MVKKDSVYRDRTLRIALGTIALMILLLAVTCGAEANTFPITQTNSTILAQAQPTNTNQTSGEIHLIGQVNVHNLPTASGVVSEKNNIQPVHHVDEQQFTIEKAQAGSQGFVPFGERAKVFATISTLLPAVSSNLILEGISGDSPNPCGCSPPDPNVGVGPNHVFEMVNLAGIIYYKNGTIAKGTFPLSNFFNLPTFKQNGALAMSDPEILYDSGSGRWFASIIDLTNNRVQLAISTSNDPTGNWNLYNVSTPNSYLPDQPIIGISDDKFVISANDFIGNTFEGFQYWIFNKSELVAGASIVHFNTNSPNPSFASVHPAQHLGSSSGQFYMVTVYPAGTVSTATLFTIGGVPPNPITIKTNSFAINPISGPPNAAQPGTLTTLDTGDDRVLSAVWENNTLWFSANDACIPSGDGTTRSCVRLIQITTSGTAPPTKGQDFDYAAPGEYFFYPAISLFQGQLVAVYGLSSSMVYPSLLVTGRTPSDAINMLYTPLTIRSGTAPDTSGRYGDYFGAATDPTPSTSSTFWVTGEYRVSSGSQSWNTAIARVAALITPTLPEAPNITSFSPTSPVIDTASATRTFNITINQTVNVTWYINGTLAQDNGSVPSDTLVNYTNTSTSVGFWNVTAIVINTSTGLSASQKWDWNINVPPQSEALNSIIVSPSTASLTEGGTQKFNATALDQNNNPIAGVTIAWTVSNLAVGNVIPVNATTDGDGNASTIFTALATGTTIVNATNGTVVGSAVVTVNSKSVAGVTNLTNISYAQTYINWTWIDPKDPNFSKVMVYLDGNFKANVTKGMQYYNATNLKTGTQHTISTRTMDTIGNISLTWVNNTAMTAPDFIPPASITNLTNISYAQTYINWTWIDPKDSDFNWVKVYIDGIFKTNVTKGKQYYNATSLKAGTAHTISTKTEDINGNINQTWVNNTAMTMPDLYPPASITNLTNVSYTQTYINWTWTDPKDLDFKQVKVYLDGTFKINVTKGKQYYNATFLKAGTVHTISTRTEDINGNINLTWVNDTEWTEPDLIPPTSVTNLTNTSYAQIYINWTWTDPKDSDFKWVKVYIDGVFKTNVTKGKQYYNATSLKAGTVHTISTRTEDINGNINLTWVNDTEWTAPDLIPPASITNLTNVSYARTYINWTWTDPKDTDFNWVMVYIDGKFRTNVTKGKQYYNATSLTVNVSHTISAHTEDINGNINQTWVNDTEWTAP